MSKRVKRQSIGEFLVKHEEKENDVQAELVEEKEADLKEGKKEQFPKDGKPRKNKSSGPFEWVDYKPHEIEEVIISLANTGKSPSEIGMVLRDQYGVPEAKKVIGKKIEHFLVENKHTTEVPYDLLNLIRKSVAIEKHLKENRHDMTAKRGLELTVSKIRRLVTYYHKSGKLSRDWKYTSERAALLIK